MRPQGIPPSRAHRRLSLHPHGRAAPQVLAADLAVTEPPSEASRRRLSRPGPAAAAAAILAAVLFLTGPRFIVWVGVKTWLAAIGAPAQIRIDSASLDEVRAHGLLGDGPRPDADLGALTVGYRIDGPWSGRAVGLTVLSVRSAHPLLRASWDGSRLSFGRTQPLVDALARLPVTAPLPDVRVEDAELDLQTPYGALLGRGSANAPAGALAALDADIAPSRLSVQGRWAVTVRGRVHAERRGGTLALTADAPVEAETAAHEKLAGRIGLQAEARPDGRVHLVADASAPSASAPGAAAGGLRFSLDYAGTSAAGRMTGVARIRGSAESFVGAGAQATGVSVVGETTRFEAVSGAEGLRIDAAGRIRADAARLAARGGAVTAAHADVGLASARFEFGTSADWRLDGRAQGSASRIDTGAATATGVELAASGVAAASGVDARLAVLAHGALAPTLVARAAGQLGAVNAAYAPAARAALSDVALDVRDVRVRGAPGRLTLEVAAPGALVSGSGARADLTLSARQDGAGLSGQGHLRLAGGGLPGLELDARNARIVRSGLSADVAISAGFKTAALEAGALTGSGPLTAARGALRFALNGCAHASAARAVSGASSGETLAVGICPGTAPLFDANANAWRVSARLQDGQVKAQDAGLSVTNLTGEIGLRAAGRGAPEGELVLGSAEVTQTSGQTSGRISAPAAPLRLSGRARLAAGVLTGSAAAATAAGRTVIEVTAQADLARARGSASLATGPLDFAPGALQPGDLVPAAGRMRNARGKVSFDADLAWSASGSVSRGELHVTDLGFSSPVGTVVGMNADIRLSSLVPLATPSDQTVTIRAVNGPVDLTDVSIRLAAAPDALIVRSASASVAHGEARLAPMRIPLREPAPVDGALALTRVDLGEILAASSLADSVKAQMVVTGEVPFRMSDRGLEVRRGHISAVGPGRISISRKALTGIAGSAGGTPPVQALAYDALENLAYDRLEADVQGEPDGRLRLLFHINGRYDPPTKANPGLPVADLLRGRAFDRKIPLPPGTGVNLNLNTSLNLSEILDAIAAAWSAPPATTPTSPVHGDPSLITPADRSAHP